MPRPLRTDRKPHRLYREVLVGTAFLAIACGGGGGRGFGGADPRRRSETEYDLARDLFLSRRNPRGALEHAQRAVQLDDDNAEAHHLVALIYLYFCSASPLECRLPEAEAAAQRAVKVRKEFREAHNTLGVILIQGKKYDEAISVLKPLANDILYQTPWDAWGNLGLAYLEKGLIEDAIVALRRSVAAEPRFCVGNYRLGLAFERKKDWTLAREALTRALETNKPECQLLQEAFEARGRVLYLSQECTLARQDWQRCQQIAADSAAGQRCAANLRSSPC